MDVCHVQDWGGVNMKYLSCVCYVVYVMCLSCYCGSVQKTRTRQNMLCICYGLYVMYMLKDDVCCLSVKHDHFCKLDVHCICNYVMYLLYCVSDTRLAMILAVVCSISVM